MNKDITKICERLLDSEEHATEAGRRYYPVDAISETPKKVRVRILAAGGVMLPKAHCDEAMRLADVAYQSVMDKYEE